MIALLLDLANIFGGFLLAIPLLAQIPRIGDDLVTADRSLAPFAWVVGVVALVTGGYYLIVHLVDGPQVFHFELIGIAVGVALLWDRLTGGRRPGHGGAGHGGTLRDRFAARSGTAHDRATGLDRATAQDPATPSTNSAPDAPHAPAGTGRRATTGSAEGARLLLAIFGLIAILVGIQGLFTAD